MVYVLAKLIKFKYIDKSAARWRQRGQKLELRYGNPTKEISTMQ